MVPLSIVILFGLFAVQSRGTARVAQFFGPIMVVWFVVLALGGIYHIVQDPRVLMGALAGLRHIVHALERA